VAGGVQRQIEPRLDFQLFELKLADHLFAGVEAPGGRLTR
jgi:hypothetical protein